MNLMFFEDVKVEWMVKWILEKCKVVFCILRVFEWGWGWWNWGIICCFDFYMVFIW